MQCSNLLFRLFEVHHPRATTMAKTVKDRKIKTDKREAALIAKYLTHHDYIHVQTEHDEQIKEYIHMRH